MKKEYIVDIRGQLWQDSSSPDKRKVITTEMLTPLSPIVNNFTITYDGDLFNIATGQKYSFPGMIIKDIRDVTNVLLKCTDLICNPNSEPDPATATAILTSDNKGFIINNTCTIINEPIDNVKIILSYDFELDQNILIFKITYITLEGKIMQSSYETQYIHVRDMLNYTQDKCSNVSYKLYRDITIPPSDIVKCINQYIFSKSQIYDYINCTLIQLDFDIRDVAVLQGDYTFAQESNLYLIIDTKGKIYELDQCGDIIMHDKLDDFSPWVAFVDLNSEHVTGIRNLSNSTYLVNNKLTLRALDIPRDIFQFTNIKSARSYYKH